MRIDSLSSLSFPPDSSQTWVTNEADLLRLYLQITDIYLLQHIMSFSKPRRFAELGSRACFPWPALERNAWTETQQDALKVFNGSLRGDMPGHVRVSSCGSDWAPRVPVRTHWCIKQTAVCTLAAIEDASSPCTYRSVLRWNLMAEETVRKPEKSTSWRLETWLQPSRLAWLKLKKASSTWQKRFANSARTWGNKKRRLIGSYRLQEVVAHWSCSHGVRAVLVEADATFQAVGLQNSGDEFLGLI